MVDYFVKQKRLLLKGLSIQNSFFISFLDIHAKIFYIGIGTSHIGMPISRIDLS